MVQARLCLCSPASHSSDRGNARPKLEAASPDWSLHSQFLFSATASVPRKPECGMPMMQYLFAKK